MDKSSATPPILGTLRTVEFRLGLKGYNVDEVDEYLEKAAIEAESLQEQLRTAQERLRQADQRVRELEAEVHRAAGPGAEDEPGAEAAQAPGRPEVSEDTLQRTLVLAQKFVEQTKRESEAEAAEIVHRAEERAKAMLAQAEETARKISTEAEQRLRDEVARLDGLRTRLAGEVEAMSSRLHAQRDKIRASLIEALEWIDERMQTGAAPDRSPADAPQGSEPGHGGIGDGEPAGPPVTAHAAASPAGPLGRDPGDGDPAPSQAGDRAHAQVGARAAANGSDLFTSAP